MKKTLLTIFTILAMVVVSDASVGNSFEPQKKKKKLEEKAPQSERDAREVARLVKEVRKELVTIPFFGVFDWLDGNIQPDGTVYLRGETVRPTIKKDAERRVEKIEGVSKVVNEIEVLPLSSSDDRLRAAVFQSLYNSGSPLFRYGQQANPSIHIIIKNGRLTLKGVVLTKGDSSIATARASSVFGLFEVKNELRIEASEKK
ncbi:MAG: BON domain-containing protein [Blastocatellia bacterium]